MTTTTECPLTKSENAVNLALREAGCHPRTTVEWDDEIGQWFLNVDRPDFVWFEAIKAALKTEGFHLDEFVNGHGFIRPASVARRLDLALPYWTYSLWQ